MCKSENHVPVVELSKELRIPDVLLMASGDKLQAPGAETGLEKFCNPMCQARRIQARHRATDCTSEVSRHWETGHLMLQSGFNFPEKACLVIPPTHTMSWWNNL